MLATLKRAKPRALKRVGPVFTLTWLAVTPSFASGVANFQPYRYKSCVTHRGRSMDNSIQTKMAVALNRERREQVLTPSRQGAKPQGAFPPLRFVESVGVRCLNPQTFPPFVYLTCFAVASAPTKHTAKWIKRFEEWLGEW